MSLAVIGCSTESDDSGNPAPAPTLTVRLSASQIQWVDGSAPAPTITAVLTDSNGVETDVTGMATFDVSPAELASVDAATIVASGQAAGAGTLTARLDDLTATASFEVYLTKTVAGTAAPTAPGLFVAATADPSQALTIAYPPAGALMPPNLGALDVHWRDPAGKDVYEVVLSGGYVTIATYVTTLGAATYTTLASEHFELLSSGASGVALNVRVRGLSSAAPATYIEGTQALRIAAQEVRGGVYYWNATRGAVMRFDMTAPATAPERFYPPEGQSGCVGCHAVSRDGKVVAFRREGANLNYGNAVKVEGLTTMLGDTAQQWNFSAIHPNDQDLFTTSESGLYRTDLATGQTSPLFTSTRISHPDVAVAGNAIVATQVLGGNEVWTTASRLVVFDYDATAKTVGTPRTLVQPTGNAYAYYPSFSADDQWVLFNQATGGSTYDNPNAELWVTKADGSGAPIRLTQAELAGTYNSWPKWTPFVTYEPTANGGTETVMWFTMASRRAFGVRSNGGGAPQLWLAPFYPDRAAAGQPASAPAVRLPFQTLGDGNHIAQWTEEIVTIQ